MRLQRRVWRKHPTVNGLKSRRNPRCFWVLNSLVGIQVPQCRGPSLMSNAQRTACSRRREADKTQYHESISRIWTSRMTLQWMASLRSKKTVCPIILIQRPPPKLLPNKKRISCAKIYLSNAKSSAIISHKCIRILIRFSIGWSQECSNGCSSMMMRSVWRAIVSN